MAPKIELLAVVAVGLVAGCSDVCEDARDICGVDVIGGSDGAECSGVEECQSQCIVDFETCDSISNEQLHQCQSKCGS